MFPSFVIFGKTITSYGLCILIGCALILGYEALVWRKKRDSYTDRILLFAIVFSCMGIGAFLLQEIVQIRGVLKALPLLFTDIKEFIRTVPTGFVMYGGLFGAFAGFIVYGAIFHLDMREELRISVPVFALFHAVGRVGCALSGCCYGFEVTSGGIWNEVVGHYCFPVQLIEAAAELVMSFALVLICRKWEKLYSTTGIYLTFYGIIRFILEFFRGDAVRGHILSLSTSQWISLIIIPLGIYCLIAPDEKNFLNLLFNRERSTSKKTRQMRETV